VFLVALVMRGLHFWAMRDSVFFDVLVCDGRQYDIWARQIAGGNWLGSEIFYQTPFYPYLLGLIYTIAGQSVWAVRFVQALFGATSCALLARGGSAWFSPRVGWIAGLLLAVYPPAIFFDGIIQKASLDLILMTALLWATGTAQRQARPIFLLAIGVLLGCLALNRENAVILIPVLAVWAVWLEKRGNGSLSWSPAVAVRLAALSGGIALILVPVGLRNYYVGGQFLLTTSQMGPNFYIGNHAGASGLYEPLRPDRGDPLFERTDAKLLAEQDLGQALSPGEISDYWMNRSWQDIKSDPVAWLKLLARKWLLTWHRIELVDAEGVRVHMHHSWPLAVLGWWHFGVLCPLAAAGIWLTRRDWRRLWLLYAMLGLFAFAVAMFFVFARYRYPLVPICMLFAAAAVAEAWQLIKGRRAAASDFLGAAIAAVLVAIACNWPLQRLENDEVTYVTVANSLLDDDRAEEAIEVLRMAQRISPNSVMVLHNLGSTATKAKRFDDADRYLQQAIRLDPKHALTYQALGDVRQQRGDLAGAEREWRKTIELDPLLAHPHRSLGSLARARGDNQQAIEHLRRALELESRYFAARVELALALLAAGDVAGARGELALTTGAYPRPREANNLAWVLATAPDDSLRNPEEALRLARFACTATDDREPDLLDTLAAAEANAGNYAEALRRVDQALRLAKEKQQVGLERDLAARRLLYAAEQPYRDHSLMPASAQPAK
jgi:tetratricopeptide (TPR) repeat protein